ARIFPVEIDVAKQFQRSRSQIAASRIEDRVVIGKRHILQPAIDHVLVECGPAAIAALKAELPGQSATKQILVALGVAWLDKPKRGTVEYGNRRDHPQTGLQNPFSP